MTMTLRKRVKFEFKDLEGPVDTLYPTLIIDLKCTACAVKKHHSANVEDTQLYYPVLEISGDIEVGKRHTQKRIHIDYK